MGRFSSWSKPFGLSRLTVSYTQDGEPRAIHLVPYESVLDPTWVTSKLVASWHETLSQVEELSGRVAPPHFETEAPRLSGKGIAAAAFLVLVVPLAVVVLVGWLVTRF